MSTHISASFTFDNWDEQEVLDRDGIRLVRTTFVKRFSGGLEGSSCGEMVMAHAQEGSAAYCGFELVQGCVEDRSGTFVLRHNAVMAAGVGSSDVEVMASSGTGGFAGLAGTANIDRHEDGSHTFTLDVAAFGDS